MPYIARYKKEIEDYMPEEAMFHGKRKEGS
jgi:hypothetical protein